MDDLSKWLSLEEAAKHFGYSHPENLRQRLRELRKRGKVADVGKPPLQYTAAKKETKGRIVVFWLNPKTALMRSDAPPNLFIPRRGRRALEHNRS